MSDEQRRVPRHEEKTPRVVGLANAERNRDAVMKRAEVAIKVPRFQPLAIYAVLWRVWVDRWLQTAQFIAAIATVAACATYVVLAWKAVRG